MGRSAAQSVGLQGWSRGRCARKSGLERINHASHHYRTDDSKEGIAATLPFTVALTEEHLRPSDRTYNGPLSGGEALSRQFLR